MLELIRNKNILKFLQAILEAESEWAENKSIIDLKNQNIRKSVKFINYLTDQFLYFSIIVKNWFN
jgi:hypothetical protein